MAPSISISIVALAFLAGCGSTLQVGLANAPWIGGDSPETRVHNVIANGHDACERSGFPEGEVLRGHTPPCDVERTSGAYTAWRPEPAVSRAPVLPWHGFGVCAIGGTGVASAELTMPGVPATAEGDVVCDASW